MRQWFLWLIKQRSCSHTGENDEEMLGAVMESIGGSSRFFCFPVSDSAEFVDSGCAPGS
jgi:hypothetical protein